MIKISQCYKSYGRFKAVDGLDLEVSAGQVFGFLGPNGAGKTTTIKMMAGLLRPDSGDIWLNGHSITQDPQKAKADLAYVPDRPELFPYLTAMETMRLTAKLFEIDSSETDSRAKELLETFGLSPWAFEPVSSFSHGMKQKLSIAAALLHKPKVFILDEPMVGLDPRGGRLIKELMRKLADKGHTVFMSIHTLEIAEKVCDRLAILHQGKILTQGTPEEIKSMAQESSGELENAFLKLTGEDEAASLDHVL